MRKSDFAAIVFSSAVLLAGWSAAANAALRNEFPGDSQRRWCLGQLQACLQCTGQLTPAQVVSCQASCAQQAVACYPKYPADEPLDKKPRPVKPVLHGPVTTDPISTRSPSPIARSLKRH
jgi:hypothetical protein